MLPDQIQHQLIGWQIAFLGYFIQYGFIGKIIVVIMIVTNVEKAISSEPEWLVDLEV
jgi:hypothetical protein